MECVYLVRESPLAGWRGVFEVWREGTGRVRCSCAGCPPEGPQHARCVHVLAAEFAFREGLVQGAARRSDPVTLTVGCGTYAAWEEKILSRAREEKNGADEGAGQPAKVVPITFVHTLRMLKEPVDPRLVKQREGWRDRGGNTVMVDYVEWTTVADRLDAVAPNWSHAVRRVQQIGGLVVVVAAITIDGVTREGVGTGTADNETGIKKAEHDALKRAAVKFGIARELYRGGGEVGGGGPRGGGGSRDGRAASQGDLVTPKQLGMIRALAREADVDPDEECQANQRCRTEELSKLAASSFIDHLKGLGGGARRAS